MNKTVNTEPKPIKVKPKKKSALKMILLTLLTVVVLFGVIITAFLVFYKPSFTGANPRETLPVGSVDNADDPVKPDGENEQKPNINTGKDRKSDVYTFLLIGRDAASASTDVIMLVTYNVKDKDVAILSIPRDTYVDTDKSYKKINAQYAFGYNNAIRQGKTKTEAQVFGINQLISSVEKTFGVPVDQYAFIDLDGFKSVVDIMGGVDVDIPFDLKYNDPEQGLRINLKKGLTHLDGEMAEQLVRFRSGYAEADIGRIKMQKIFLSAVINKMLDSNISQVTKIVEQGIKNMKTDISLVNMLYFAKEALNLSTDSIHMHTAPGEGKMIDGAAYYILYADETIQILNKYYNPNKTDITTKTCDIIEFERASGQSVNIDGDTVDSITEQQPDIIKKK
ncbi:MAG: LCP family protein [Eubacteriales bacterium]